MQDVTGLPRYFWRRALAYVIDVTAIQIVFTVLFYALALATPWNIGFSPFNSIACEQAATGPLVDKVEAQWPLKPGEKRLNQICRVSQFDGHPPNGYFTTSVVTTSGASTYTRSVSTQIDQNGNAIDATGAGQLSSLMPLLIIPLAFAFFTANGRRTLGKRIMSLRVATIDSHLPTLKGATFREVLKFLPLIALVFVIVVFFLLQSPMVANFDHMVAAMRDGTAVPLGTAPWIYGAILVAGFTWWLLPLAVWRGQTFYDRFSGCKVLRT
ncbi:RDD family protein [Rhizobium tubonense]|uniref:RDD family protein n=1 Tax=Rhizobium tubonense TaxID=484088 RepID=UPI0018A83E7D|nr:RDD family protein [Rhizobium tubonense]